RAPGARPELGRPCRPARARSRQDGRGLSRRSDDLPWPPRPPRGRALSLARRRPGAPRLPGVQREGARRRDGRPPPRAARRGRPVSSRVDPHRPRARPDRQFPERSLSPPMDTLRDGIDALAGGRDLSQDEAAFLLAEIMAGGASEIQIAALLIALRTK